MATKPLDLIASPQVEGEALTAAIKSLGPPAEAASFWTKIANSDSYSADHRRRAIFALFGRHVSPGITLGQLGKILDHPTWLRDDDIDLVTVVGGKLPVHFSAEDTIVVFTVFAMVPDGIYQSWAIYLTAAGKIDRAQIIAVLRGDQSASTAATAKIMDLGFAPPNPFRML